MKIVTCSEARQNLSELLVLAQKEEVEIRHRDGSVFSLRAKRSQSRAPVDVPGIKTKPPWMTSSRPCVSHGSADRLVTRKQLT